ncbi:MAG: SDR family NAD(P)-dependent oxidoreductase [Raineya sp.]|jgi:short-subunit dehydrogenase|nr:SDR family NAD(P)-dependent oxidoreductase [Raineya sp.]
MKNYTLEEKIIIMQIHHQYIVLTGAASGIGKEILILLAKYKCHILAVDMNEALLNETILNIPESEAQIKTYTTDLSLQKNTDALFEYALQIFPQIDIFIANAGFAYYEKLTTPDWQHIEKIYQVNVFSPIYSLLKMKEINKGREYYVCMTASAMAKMGLAGYALYSSTKASLDRFADAYQYETDDKGILGLVYPIATKTNFFEKAGNAPLLFPSQTASQVAKAILRGILKNKKSIIPSKIFWFSHILSFVQEFMNTPYQYYTKRFFKAKILNKA